MIDFTSVLSNDLGSAPGTYHYDITTCAPLKLAAISSDDSLRILDATMLNTVQEHKSTHKNGVTCLIVIEPHIIATAGHDGIINIWDIRTTNAKAAAVFKKASNAPILSIAASTRRNCLASGSELTSHTASLILWDLRHQNVLFEYVESHNDDITELVFHPAEANVLLSGSTDNLINVYNLDITDEEDALHQVINHGSSVHHSGFLSPTAIYGLSHDEMLSVYQLANPSEEVEEPTPVVFGDLRAKLDCEYVIDVLARGDLSGVGIVAAGSHSNQTVQLYSLKPEPSWNLAAEDVIQLTGAHGEEIVRCIVLDDATSTVFTGGEDGVVKAWRASEVNTTSASASQDPSTIKSKRKKDKGRFAPY